MDNGVINLLTVDHINEALENVEGKHKSEGRALIIALYYSGGRPVELLNLLGQSIYREKSYLVMKLEGSKNGLPRLIYLQYKKSLVKELYEYSQGCFPQMYLFPHFRGNHTRTTLNKKGELRHYEEITSRLRYHFKRWFKHLDGIPPYFLRHNRFSKLSDKGLNDSELQHIKGSRTLASVQPYKHLSTKKARDIARYND